MAATSSVAFTHDGARDGLIKDIKKYFGVNCKVTSFPDHHSKTGGNVYSVEFVFTGDGNQIENIQNIKINQSTSALHPSCINKNSFKVLIYIKDGSKDAIYEMFGDSNNIKIGQTVLSYSEFPDNANYYHGLISFTINCELKKVGDNVKEIIKKINHNIEMIYAPSEIAEVQPVEPVEPVQLIQAVTENVLPVFQTVQPQISYSAVINPATVMSVGGFRIEEEYEAVDEDIIPVLTSKSEDYKNALDSNVVKLKKLTSDKSAILKEISDDEKALQVLLERIESKNKKIESIEKSIQQITANDAKIKEKIKAEVENLSALIKTEVTPEVKAEVKAEVIPEVIPEVKVEVKVGVKPTKSSKKKNKTKLATLVETPDENSGVTPAETSVDTSENTASVEAPVVNEFQNEPKYNDWASL
jgi:hypothetical protein